MEVYTKKTTVIHMQSQFLFSPLCLCNNSCNHIQTKTWNEIQKNKTLQNILIYERNNLIFLRGFAQQSFWAIFFCLDNLEKAIQKQTVQKINIFIYTYINLLLCNITANFLHIILLDSRERERVCYKLHRLMRISLAITVKVIECLCQ